MTTKMYRSDRFIQNPFEPSMSAADLGAEFQQSIDSAKLKLYQDIMYLIESRSHSLWMDRDPKSETWHDDYVRKCEIDDLIVRLKQFDPRETKRVKT